MQNLILILALASLAEALTEYFFAPWVQALPGQWVKEAPKYIALCIGVLLAYNFRADLFALFGFASRTPEIGYMLTGVLIGRGSNYVNDFVTRYFQKPEPPIVPPR